MGRVGPENGITRRRWPSRRKSSEKRKRKTQLANRRMVTDHLEAHSITYLDFVGFGGWQGRRGRLEPLAFSYNSVFER